MTWTREHDRILAEKCEGWTAKVRPGVIVNWPRYSTDLVAAVRAAEAWRKGDENARNWSIVSPEYGDTVMRGFVYNGRHPDWRTQSAYSEQPAVALAHALYQAVVG